MGNKIITELLSCLDNPYASQASDGLVGDVTKYIDTGSYALNALLSGSIYGGLPANKITALAGEEATGKTYFLLGIFKHFLDSSKDAVGVLFESEGAITKEILKSRGIDPERLIMVPVTTVEEFRHQAVKLLDTLAEKENRPPVLLGLDSLGMLSTSKEVEDITSGSDKRDMTKAQLIKGTFRVLTLKLSKLDVPMVVTNHTYTQIGVMYADNEMGGGSGLKYAASNIVFLSKKKFREDKESDVSGVIIHCKTKKSRLTKENQVIDVLLTYDKGLNRYYGLTEVAEKYEVFKKKTKGYEMPDGSTAYDKNLRNDPEKYFTEDVLNSIEDACKKEFLYGSWLEQKEETDESTTEETPKRKTRKKSE